MAARRLELLVEQAQLARGAVQIVGELAQLVPARHLDPPAEVALGDAAQPGLDLGHRPDQRPGDDIAEPKRQEHAAESDRDHDPPRPRVCLLAGVDAGDHLGLGEVDQLVGEALQAVRQGPRLVALHLARLGDPPGAGQLHDPGHDRDEAVVVAPHPGEQLDLVAGDVLQPVQVVAELGELAQRRLEHLLVRGQQRGGDAVELCRGVVLHLAEGRDLALQPDQLFGLPVDAMERLQTHRTHQHQQRRHGEERHQELGLDARRQARDDVDHTVADAHQGSCNSSKRSSRNSSGSNRKPRYWTRMVPCLSTSVVNKVCSTCPSAVRVTATP